MVSFESILDFFKRNFWSTLFFLILGALAIFLYRLKKRVFEGFQSENGVLSIEKMMVCPTIKMNLAHNTALLEEYKKNDRVVSVQNTQSIIETFTNSYNIHECDAYFADPNNPKTVPRKEVDPELQRLIDMYYKPNEAEIKEMASKNSNTPYEGEDEGEDKDV
jgi:hypothetical protein